MLIDVGSVFIFLIKFVVMHTVNHLVYLFRLINRALLTRLVVRCKNTHTYQASLIMSLEC